MTTPRSSPFIAHFSEIPANKQWSYSGSRETFGVGRCLSRKLGLTKIGVWHETLAPGARTSWPHAHSHDEEFAYVLEGHPQVWLDGELHDLHPGDSVAFVPGSGHAHVILNDTDRPVVLLVVGDDNPDHDKIFYSLHSGRNAEAMEKGVFWHGHPEIPAGPHDGLTRILRKDGEGPNGPR